MLSDEEEAIEWLKRLVKINKRDNLDDTFAEILLNLIEKQSKEIEHQIEKRENQKKELAILNAKQIEFNKLVNTVNSYKGQFKRQQKEIEELKEENKPQPDCAEPIEKTEEMVNMNWVNHNYIGKDKIKEILGIEEDINNEKLLSLLQTIVDENARLEDIEDRKVQIEYNNVFNKGVKSVKDKIKAKIEPKLKELDEQMKKEWKEYGNSREYQDMEDEWNFLQSLLEKE